MCAGLADRSAAWSLDTKSDASTFGPSDSSDPKKSKKTATDLKQTSLRKGPAFQLFQNLNKERYDHPQQIDKIIQKIPNKYRIPVLCLFCLNKDFVFAQKIARLHSVKKKENPSLFFDLEWIDCLISVVCLNRWAEPRLKLYRLYKMAPSGKWKSKAAFLLGQSFLKQRCFAEAALWFRKSANWNRHFYGMLSQIILCQLWRMPWVQPVPSKMQGYKVLPSDLTGNLLSYAQKVFPVIPPSFLKSLVHAVIKNESSFRVDAKSSAGASGLMQLMPATAQSTFNKLVQEDLVKEDETYDLYQLSDNIVLGTTHLCRLISHYNGNIILIAAAYNAGKNAVEKWKRVFGQPGQIFPSWAWIELIPFSETRAYVQKVIESFLIYAKFFGQREFTPETLGLL